MKDKWITPDNYHLQDLFVHGRCLYCGKLALVTATHKGTSYNHCGAECSAIINELIDELAQKPSSRLFK